MGGHKSGELYAPIALEFDSGASWSVKQNGLDAFCCTASSATSARAAGRSERQHDHEQQHDDDHGVPELIAERHRARTYVEHRRIAGWLDAALDRWRGETAETVQHTIVVWPVQLDGFALVASGRNVARCCLHAHKCNAFPRSNG